MLPLAMVSARAALHVYMVIGRDIRASMNFFIKSPASRGQPSAYIVSVDTGRTLKFFIFLMWQPDG